MSTLEQRIEVNLIDKYGYCVVPKGTILIRSGESHEFNDCIFFGLDLLVGGYQDRAKVQIWETLKDFRLLFMVTHVTSSSWVISAITEIYKSQYPEEKGLDDLDIKQRDFNKRKKLIDILMRQGIIGWLSSLEDNPALEVCLFPTMEHFKTLIYPLADFDVSDYRFHNSLNDLKIYPSDLFYERSKPHLNSHMEYARWFKLECEEVDPNEVDSIYRRDIDLRMKLEM